MNDWRTKYLVDVPPGTCGDCVVERFEVDKAAAEWSALRAAVSFSFAGRAIPEGHYTVLRINGAIVMSDTPSEIRDLFDAFHYARGRCLVTGLGLGIAMNGMLRKPEVEHVTVVEINPAVVELVGNHWLNRFGDRLTIVTGDAFKYWPRGGVRFNYAWHDIWPTISADNIDDMKRLHRRYGRRCDKQGSWCRSLCERLR